LLLLLLLLGTTLTVTPAMLPDSKSPPRMASTRPRMAPVAKQRLIQNQKTILITY
jgi:hypothetical protein